MSNDLNKWQILYNIKKKNIFIPFIRTKPNNSYFIKKNRNYNIEKNNETLRVYEIKYWNQSTKIGYFFVYRLLSK